MTESPNAPRPDDPLIVAVADALARVERNYDREGSGPGSRFEGRLLEDVQAERAVSMVRAAMAQERWNEQAAGSFGHRFTVIPDSGDVELSCSAHSPSAERWRIGYHPSLDVVVQRARAHNHDWHSDTGNLPVPCPGKTQRSGVADGKSSGGHSGEGREGDRW